jgi:hypothetical protein
MSVAYRRLKRPHALPAYPLVIGALRLDGGHYIAQRVDERGIEAEHGLLRRLRRGAALLKRPALYEFRQLVETRIEPDYRRIICPLYCCLESAKRHFASSFLKKSITNRIIF